MADEPPAPVQVMPMSPAATPEAQAMSAVAAAVRGPGTPDHAAVKATPSPYAIWALILGGPALSLGIVAMCATVVWKFWPDAVVLRSVPLMDRIITGWFAVVCGLVAALCLVVFRLAAGGLKRVDARAGPAGLTIETDG